MALTTGTRLGAYEVLALLGSGGMGEVYRARDTRLDRIVAIKVLPANVASDPDRRQRLDREARAISSLNHPHICTLYDVGHQDGIDYLVMELLEGQTLAERLIKGALPLDQAMQYAIQLADALDVAHRRGIVHRDLKPANVFISRSGSSGTPIAKLLDFGIAKAIALSPAAATVSATLTNEGTLLGTVQYMAPEQLEGREADTRSDLFAFGAVLYEMLTGHRAFPGENQASVIAAVLDSDPPPVSASQSLTPPALEHLVKTCLAKNPDERWQTAGDVKRQLEWIATSSLPTGQATTVAQRASSGVHVPWTAALVTAIVAIIVVGTLARYVWTGPPEQTAPPRVTRTTIVTSGGSAVFIAAGRSLAITPDGTRVVYIGNSGTQLFVRAIDQFDSIPIFTSLSPLNQVSVSPDGQSVVFAEGNTLRTIALTGGPAKTIIPGIAGYGAAWAADGTIVLPVRDRGGLHRVPDGGGDVTTLTRPDAEHGELAHVWPAMLPGGRAVLFTITATTGGLDAAQIAVLDLVSLTSRVLVRGGSDAHYVPGGLSSPESPDREGGHLVYVKGSTLVAVPFDLARMEVRGTPVPVLTRLATMSIGSGHFDVAANGTLLYLDADSRAAPARTLVWVDRQGLETPLSASLPARPYGQPRVSPDETQVAVAINDEENDIWVWDIAGKTPLRKLTSGPETDFFPVWTTNSRRLLFGRPGGGFFWQAADGTGKEEALTSESDRGMLPSGVTPDGTRVLFSLGARDVMAMALDARRVEPLVQTQFNERNGDVAPDGRWLAYESDASGKFEIYVTPFPKVASAGEWPISTAGGTRPLWAPNGQELFFVAPDGAMMAVRVAPQANVWRSGSPVKLFGGPYATGAPASGRNYDVSKDGKRFLTVKSPPSDQSAAPQIELVQHWAEELKRLVPAAR